MKNQQNNICRCGHKLEDHFESYFEEGRYVCYAKKFNSFKFVDDCREYQLDNLRFLENLSYEKETTEA